jgi:hypothetical protein
LAISGTEGLTAGEVADEVRRGGRFVVFSYCMSILFVTLQRSSKVHFIRAGESAASRALPYTLVSLLLGWWGIPWGIIFTPVAVISNLRGGKDVTADVMALRGGAGEDPRPG